MMKATFVQDRRVVAVISLCAMLMVCSTSQVGTIISGTSPAADIVTSVSADQGGRIPSADQLLVPTAGPEALAMGVGVPVKVGNFADCNLDITTRECRVTTPTVDNGFLFTVTEDPSEMDHILWTTKTAETCETLRQLGAPPRWPFPPAPSLSPPWSLGLAITSYDATKHPDAELLR
jgi:hypothetical protein